MINSLSKGWYFICPHHTQHPVQQGLSSRKVIVLNRSNLTIVPDGIDKKRTEISLNTFEAETEILSDNKASAIAGEALVPWILVHQQQYYSVCRKRWSMSSTRNNFSYLYLSTFEIWYKSKYNFSVIRINCPFVPLTMNEIGQGNVMKWTGYDYVFSAT